MFGDARPVIGIALVTALALAACGDGGGDDAPTDGYFPPGSIYEVDLSGATPVANSAAIVATMMARHPPNGWGTGRMRIDFGLVVNRAPAGTPRQPFQLVEDYYYPPECDHARTPLPPGGAVEVDWRAPPVLDGLRGYDCTTFDDGGDCHILVHAPHERRLYEIYHATVRPDGTFLGGCQAVWDTSRPATAEGRGQQCTSADAAGYAIAPLLVTPEEVASGEIRHAVRLVLPNDVIRRGVYYSPATHGTSSSGPEDSLPYGGRLRLRADYPIDDLAPAARVVARAMQTYGLMLADGGNIALTMSSDVLSPVSWDDVGLTPSSLDALRADDFEVIIDGEMHVIGAEDCRRTPIVD